MAEVRLDPYAAGKTVETPTAPRAPASTIPFLWAACVFALSRDGQLWHPLTSRAIWDHFKLSGGRPSLFLGAMYAPGMLGLLWAYLSDRVPLLETRREGHLVLAGFLAIAAWLAAAGLPYAAGPWLGIGVALGLAAAVGSVSSFGALVELARRRRAPGRLAAAWVALAGLAQLAWSFARGPLSGRSWVWWAALGVPLACSVIALALFVPDGRAEPPPEPLDRPDTLGRYLRSRLFWTALVVVMVGDLVARHVGTLSGRELRAALGPDERPLVGPIYLIGQMVAACGYLGWCRRSSLLLSLAAFTTLELLVALALARAVGPRHPIAVMALDALAGGLAMAARFDLAMRAAPRRREAFGFELLWRAAPVTSLIFLVVYAFFSPPRRLGPDTTLLPLSVAVLVLAAAIALVPRPVVTPREGEQVPAP